MYGGGRERVRVFVWGKCMGGRERARECVCESQRLELGKVQTMYVYIVP